MQTAESEHIPTCRALKQLCEDAEVPTSAQDGENLIQFEALTEVWNKENANKWKNENGIARTPFDAFVVIPWRTANASATFRASSARHSCREICAHVSHVGLKRESNMST